MIKLSNIVNKIIEAKEPTLPLGKWVKADKNGLAFFRDELFKLIKQSYANIGGHHDFQSPSDIKIGDVNYWEYIDVDNDNDPDAVNGSKITPFGKKSIVAATDGSPVAKRTLIKHKIQDLKKSGFYVEASHKLADILITSGVPIVNDENEVRNVLRKNIEWIGELPGHNGDGWYYRNVSGKQIAKILLGTPKI